MTIIADPLVEINEQQRGVKEAKLPLDCITTIRTNSIFYSLTICIESTTVNYPINLPFN